jgi:hypothetical protein
MVHRTFNLRTTTTTLAPNVAAPICASDPKRRYLAIENVGAAGLDFQVDTAPTVGGGTALAAGAVSENVGMFTASPFDWPNGSRVVTRYDHNRFDPGVPSNPFYAISATGTTVVVTEG